MQVTEPDGPPAQEDLGGLRVAVPNKGSLAEAAVSMLVEAGYRCRGNARDLVVLDTENNVTFFYLRPRDIAVYVGSGVLDAGITGRDLLLDSDSGAQESLALNFAHSRFSLAAPRGTIRGVRDVEGKRVATSYPGVLQRYLESQGVRAQIVRLDGAVETAVRLKVADAIADVVETGHTLSEAGMETVGEPILRSEAVLIVSEGRGPYPGFEVFRRRIEGVLLARRYVLFDYHIHLDALGQACRITPGLETPTVSPLQDSDRVAVRSMVPKAQAQTVMDALYTLGAHAILVSSIHACRI